MMMVRILQIWKTGLSHRFVSVQEAGGLDRHIQKKKIPSLEPKIHSNTLVRALKQIPLSTSLQNNCVKVIQTLTMYSKKMKSAEVRLGGVKT